MSPEIARLDVHKVAKQGSLSAHVADQLEALILEGKAKVGEKLPTESQLCDSFGVSRTVIREAITHLKSLGLVATRRGVGTTVLRSQAVEARPAERINPTTVEDILHVLELRLALEPAAAELAALRHDEADGRRLEEKHAAFLKACAEKSQARVEDYEFHHAITQATHNPAFTQLYEQLSPSSIPRAKLLSIDINPAAAARYLERVQEEHAFILEAILSRDAEAARETMFQHLNRSRNMYAQYQES
ncbi:FadR/GntR family transcriptional regulator [Halomonas rhizosphaerae]|uniref:FadR/GntR family transcriptional regulator n=1 Tax=Halomonas rhizosphaerae TaxID=3043296 RepID=A0ABT6UVN1_9GAMM|nr:FadR/GntR family transcriptional regulator [Halomonas rhizosphaerae]MDI5889956.1 FadR/GntR family transcriptional regulator [Halomonas rhizosphaerae]MDI5919242.1 FadR/GntR family transcriptional regulator [Halomonas rhizosphaerae]